MHRWKKFVENAFRVIADLHVLLILLAIIVIGLIELVHFIGKFVQ
jgi:hypothetical protein